MPGTLSGRGPAASALPAQEGLGEQKAMPGATGLTWHMSFESADEEVCGATLIMPDDGWVSNHGSVWLADSGGRKRLPTPCAPLLIFPRELFDIVVLRTWRFEFNLINQQLKEMHCSLV